jgi:serine phosphatase RsbU (regulator of sigma subunit)
MHETDESLIRAIRHKAFYYISKPFERDVLLTLVDRCLELKRLQIAERNHAYEMKRQLQAAGAFQRTMLPVNCADIEGFTISAEYRPCESVAGDFYTYAASGDGAITVLVADVVGHGASAAMLTSIVKSAFHKARNDNFDPLSVTQLIGGDMAAFESDQFLTLICAQVCCRKGMVKYVNAGHPAGLLIDGGGAVTELPSTGPMISPVTAQLGWKTGSAGWSPDQSLLLYTDGAVEPWRMPVRGSEIASQLERNKVEESGAGVPDNVMVETEAFGEVRLREAAVDAIKNGRDALNAIITDLTTFIESAPLTDDVTLLLVQGKA